MSRPAYDVVVVGAGPAGSAAALVAARAGRRVLLIERGETAGSKNVSGAAFYAPEVLEALLPEFWRSAPVERRLTRRVIGFTGPHAALSVDFRSDCWDGRPHNGFTVLRPRFDRWLADQAAAAGATLLTETVVDGLLRDGAGRVQGVVTRRPEGEIDAQVVVAADGVNSFLAREAGLRAEPGPHELALGVKEVVALGRTVLEDRFGLTGDDGVTFEYIGSVTGDVHGGAFLYTNRESLSLGVIVQVASLAERRVPAYELLETFKAHPAVAPLVRGGRLVEYSAHLVPEAGLAGLSRLYGDGILVAGDAAGLCFAAGLYLEGINFAIASGAAAGETAAEAAAAGRADAATLRAYRRRLERSFVLRDLRRFRRAPGLVMSERLQNVYPGVMTSLAERALTSRGEPRPKLLGLARAELRRAGVPAWRALSDLWRGGRAFGW
ncbi:MAG TPA: FAD-dependent oxidoreductase [Candidatus Dormibacteraeota bacterium]|nr:FAD-dependent oxidoreductase [Candidatus Dormibacteraeota bacterium]